MDDKKLILEIYKRVYEISKETKTLYDLGEADMIILTQILMKIPLDLVSPKLLARLLRAASHLIERNVDVVQEMVKLINEKKL